MGSNNNFDLNYKIPKPKNYKKYNIGIIGAGDIVENSHLPAYLENNLNITNIFDIDESKSRYLKDKFNIEKYSCNLEEFLQDKDIDIVDIAVPAKYNKELFFETLKFNKNILIQKPLADNLETGLDILKKYKESNLKANVNHQMRYSPAIRAASYLINSKMLGNILEFNFFTKRKTDWSKWPWLKKLDYPELWYNSIHYIDSIRYLFGEPLKINAKLLKHPNSNLNKPTRTYIDFQYADDLHGNLNISHDSILAPNKWTAGFQIEGDEGTCTGRISSMIGDGKTFKDNISFSSKNSTKYIEINKELDGRWFPNAFIGPMYTLMDAIENNTQPETNINDAFETLKLINLIEKSHENQKIIFNN